MTTGPAIAANAWDQKPDLVSLGAQKNFERFMDSIKEQEGQPLPDVAAYKAMIAKAIVFKKTHSQVLPMFPAAQANVAAYLVSLLANRLGDRIVLERIWPRQGLSSALVQQIRTWATEVYGVIHRTSDGRMLSEWAKKHDCWQAVRDATYSDPLAQIPELV